MTCRRHDAMEGKMRKLAAAAGNSGGGSTSSSSSRNWQMCPVEQTFARQATDIRAISLGSQKRVHPNPCVFRIKSAHTSEKCRVERQSEERGEIRDSKSSAPAQRGKMNSLSVVHPFCPASLTAVPASVVLTWFGLARNRRISEAAARTLHHLISQATRHDMIGCDYRGTHMRGTP